MTAAYDENLIGNDFLWIIDGFDVATFHRNAIYESGSKLDLATRGVGLINLEGGVRFEIRYPEMKTSPPLQENPQTSHDKFRVAWRRTIQDEAFEAYVRSRMPESMKTVDDYNPNFTFELEASSYTPFLYDAITALGLAYCQAGNKTTERLLEGGDVYEEFTKLSFHGASGHVKILRESGTRDYRTEIFTLLNVQPRNFSRRDGKVDYNLVPIKYYESKWKSIQYREYVYAGGSTTTPEALPEPKMKNNYIGKIGRGVGYSLMIIVTIVALFSLIWLLRYRNNPVIRSSQPLFLIMLVLGSLIMASSIFPLSLEEPISISILDIACMSAPWLYTSGAIIAFSSLFAKTRGVRRAYIDPNLKFIHVSMIDIFGTFFVLSLFNLIVMLTWQIVAPLKWRRFPLNAKDKFDRIVESYGTCSNENALPFVVSIISINMCILIFANWWAYQSRNVETEYHESRYIGISMASMLQAWCMGIPILIVVWNNPQAKFFVEIAIIFVTTMAFLMFIFIPKMFAVHKSHLDFKEVNNRMMASNSVTGIREQRQMIISENDPAAQKIDLNDPIGKHSDLLPGNTPIMTGLKEVGGIRGSSKNDTTVRDIKFLDQSLKIGFVERFFNATCFTTRTMHCFNTPEDHVGGIRITHNPRSPCKLHLSGGQNISRQELENLDTKQIYVDAEFSDHYKENKLNNLGGTKAERKVVAMGHKT